MFINAQQLSAIINSPMTTYLILLKLCFTILSFIIICLCSGLHLWVPTGGVIVVDKYINKQLYPLSIYLLNIYIMFSTSLNLMFGAGRI